MSPTSREDLAARYQQLFDEAGKAWDELEAKRIAESNGETKKVERNAVKQDEGLPDPVLEAFRELSYAKAGPFRAPGDAKQYYPQSAQDEIAKLEKEKKALEDATPDLPKAMGVQEGDKIANCQINIRGSHWTLGEEVPRRFLRVIAGENQTPVPDDTERTTAIGRMAHAAGPSADQPGDGEPHLALAFRARHRAVGR